MDKVLDLIVNGSDWESALKEIVLEKGMDLWNINIVVLSEALVEHLSKLETINFRIPARFILISAVLLRMKSETLMEKPVQERIPEVLDINGINLLEMPIKRIPVRNITFEELTYALGKIVKDTQVKEEIRINKEHKIENIKKLLELDIDNYVDRVYRELRKIRKTTYYTITKGKEQLESAKYFVAMLHLANQQKVSVHQEIIFEDIDIDVREMEEIKKEIERSESENTPTDPLAGLANSQAS
ncbi:MAG: hypothetical protein JW727_04555 [Candidatus Aenigmarchaeota archaeon]|nr:hypothetical protein [Candidatus Aenigmarchaeota archaeon]